MIIKFTGFCVHIHTPAEDLHYHVFSNIFVMGVMQYLLL